jgi:trigger factor
MEIIKNNTGELEATLIVKIEEQDYREKVDKELNNIRKKANIKGFRPGKTPLGVVEKMFGRDVKAQEVTKYLDEEVIKYFDENKIDIIGELLPSEKEETKFDIEKDKNFQFAFDFGFYPETKIELAEISVPEYKILIEDSLIDEEIKNLQEKYGDFKEVEIIEEKSQFRIDLVEQKED